MFGSTALFLKLIPLCALNINPLHCVIAMQKLIIGDEKFIINALIDSATIVVITIFGCHQSHQSQQQKKKA